MNKNIFSYVNPNKGLLLISMLSFSALGFALISQHVFDMQPCAWCILQRLIFVIIGIISLIYYLTGSFLKFGYGLLSLLSTAGMTAALYQHFVASKSFDCNVSLAEKIISTSQLNDIMPNIFGIFGLCADANPEFFGIPYVIFSFILFLIISDISVLNLVKMLKGPKV
jgi:disulfide bond formation protein DsbB